MIDGAISAAEERRDRVVALAGALEASEKGDAAVLGCLRLRRLRSANATLERLCVLRQARADLDFLCSGVSALCQGDADDENLGDKVPLVAARLAAIGSALGRLRQLPPPEEEFDLASLRAEAEEAKRRRRSGRSRERRSHGRRSRTDSHGHEEASPRVRRLRMCLDVSAPLYEKVLCRVPFVLLDEAGRKVDCETEGERILDGLRCDLQYCTVELIVGTRL